MRLPEHRRRNLFGTFRATKWQAMIQGHLKQRGKLALPCRLHDRRNTHPSSHVSTILCREDDDNSVLEALSDSGSGFTPPLPLRQRSDVWMGPAGDPRPTQTSLHREQARWWREILVLNCWEALVPGGVPCIVSHETGKPRFETKPTQRSTTRFALQVEKI